MILEVSLAGSPLVQVVWPRLQYLDIYRNSVGGVWRRNRAAAVGANWSALRSETNLKRTAVEDALAGSRTRKKSKARVSPRNFESWWTCAA